MIVSLIYTDVPTVSNLTVETVGTNAVISWEYDDGGIPVQGFNLTAQEGDTTIDFFIGSDMFVPDTTVQFPVALSLLKPSTVYVVTVSGRNLLGQSEKVSFSYTTEGMVCCCRLLFVVENPLWKNNVIAIVCGDIVCD